ncbi:MAG: alpha-glucan family phosphorylase [Candidatus Sericytochromatia bacterium]|nr:alpha-glucan family phosphorylase [Candidatus Sericytochromatia bacterium]
MHLLGRVSVFPVLPARIAGLRELATNLWWVWNPEAQDLFVRLDEALWRHVYQNPVRLLSEIDQARLDEAGRDPSFLAAYDEVQARFRAYLDQKSTWFRDTYGSFAGKTVAYFSAEFGLHEALPIYSGGLGILSGDHCKSSSNLDIPFVGVGLLYNQGYFRQQLRPDGMQEALYDKLNFSELPIQPARGEDGAEVVIHVELPGRLVFAKVWQVQVGRISVYLLDTDIDRNTPEDRRFSAQLYGGDHDMRISQEIILGIGGVRALRALGIHPAAWHMNEGHSAFLGLERIRELVQQQGLAFHEALEAVAANAIFTTHTPVPAGNDAFGFQLVEKYFSRFYPQLGIGREEFLGLARQDHHGGPSLFSLSVLALRLSRQSNGVSALHGVVSRKMWQELWPGVPAEEVPIGSITNGVHTETWIAPAWRPLFDRYIGADWREALADQPRWEAIRQVPDAEVWAVRRALKVRMLEFVRQRVRQQRLRAGDSVTRVLDADTILDPDALTIGFARRFATYKRATLVFRDVARLARILNDPDRPVQLIFAGKAHPADMPGKEFIQRVVQFARDLNFSARVVFIEDYDMNVARHLVHGCDVWLNNPRRPLEASGTSGQKAAANGCLNFSVLDGWWCEGYNEVNGWSIGEEREFADLDEQDEADALSMYRTLEDEIVPLYYDQDEAGVPKGWIARVKDAIATLTPEYSTHRMVQDYTRNYYIPAIENGERVAADSYAVAKQYAEWKAKVGFHWHHVGIEVEPLDLTKAHVGDPIEIVARVRTGGLAPSNLAVELYHGRERGGVLQDVEVLPMQQAEPVGDGVWAFKGTFTPGRGGSYIYGVRALPRHDGMIHKQELALIRWA